VKHLLMALLVCFSGMAVAENNGNWWRSLPTSGKVGYVMGYLDGGCDGAMRVLDEIQPNDERLKRIQKCVWPDGVTYGQIVDGVNHFYSDYRNRLIPTDSALRCVKSEIEGKPLSQSQIEQMRKNATTTPADVDKMVQQILEGQKKKP
jgi:hypothetical protein